MKLSYAPSALLFAAAAPVTVVNACTGVTLRADDASVVIGRTMEFAVDIGSEIIVVPAGLSATTLANDSNPNVDGFTYETRLGYTGATAFGKPIVSDGLNEAGLYFGAFYFAGDAEYQELTPANQESAISAEEMGAWILSQFSSVDEVRNALPGVTVVGTVIEELQGAAPLHFSVTDVNGGAIVVEYTKDGMNIHDNTVNAVTNNPSYDWMLTNLRNYMGLSPVNSPKITVGSQKLVNIGQGTGMFGLPGDFSSPSRFVRATSFANTVVQPKDALEAVQTAFHIENNFDIPLGSVRESDAVDAHMDYTEWTTVSDTRNKLYYWKTFEAQQIQYVNLADALREAAGQVAYIQMETGFHPVDRTDDLAVKSSTPTDDSDDDGAFEATSGSDKTSLRGALRVGRGGSSSD